MTVYELNETYEEYTKTEKYKIEEGLKFFKTSKRLKKIIPVLIKKMKTNKKLSDVDRKKLSTIINKMNSLITEYEKLENQYASDDAEKNVIKAKYKTLNKKNKEVIDLLKNEEFKNIFRKIGMYGLRMSILSGLGMIGRLF
jgi:hypothetical protein